MAFVLITGTSDGLGEAAGRLLYHQINSMVGSLEQVGADRWSATDLRAALGP